MNSEFLQVYDLILTTSTPLFIGDGQMIPKKGYLFDYRSKTVSIFDENRFFDLILRRDLVDQYERFVMGESADLLEFLTVYGRMQPKDWAGAVRYELDASDSLDRNHSLKEIHTFIRNAYGQAYLPGSIKGALKTALLNQMILNNPHRDYFNPKKFDQLLDETYLHTLRLKKNRIDNAVNSLMRGIQISDSCPISDSSMILTIKRDAHVDGTFSASRGVVCRESIRPGTQIHCNLTLDQSVLKGKLTRESVMQAIDEYDEYYVRTYLDRFEEPRDAGDYAYQNSLILGGGAGFFAKTLVYPYLGEEKALHETASMMQQKFRKHKHERDEALGISPHTMEYTNYRGELYPMGLCEVKLL